jgi:hypothetical protein
MIQIFGRMVHKKRQTYNVKCISLTIGECPIDPEEADEELDADQVHKEWKEYYECQKKEMEREHKVVVRRLEKSREEIASKGEGPTNI